MDKAPSSSSSSSTSPRRTPGAHTYTGNMRSPSPRSNFRGNSSSSSNQPFMSSTPAHAALQQNPATPSIPPIGSRVKVMKKHDLRFGMVMFVGKTEFGPDTVWAGLRLDEPLGTHDGEFRKKRYFQCEPRHGLFVHAATCKVLDNFEMPPPQVAPVVPSVSLPSSMSSAARDIAVLPSNAQEVQSHVPTLHPPSNPSSSGKIYSNSRCTTAHPPVATTSNSSSNKSTNNNAQTLQPTATPTATPTAASTAVSVIPKAADDMDELILEVRWGEAVAEEGGEEIGLGRVIVRCEAHASL